MYRSLLIWRCVGVEGEKRGEAPGEMYRPQMHEGREGVTNGSDNGFHSGCVEHAPCVVALGTHARTPSVSAAPLRAHHDNNK